MQRYLRRNRQAYTQPSDRHRYAEGVAATVSPDEDGSTAKLTA
jgi:hypothetical protein